MIATSLKMTMLFRAMDCEGEVKNSQYITNILIITNEEVEPDNGVQVIMNNTKKCRVSLLVEGFYSRVVHSINLML